MCSGRLLIFLLQFQAEVERKLSQMILDKKFHGESLHPSALTAPCLHELWLDSPSSSEPEAAGVQVTGVTVSNAVPAALSQVTVRSDRNAVPAAPLEGTLRKALPAAPSAFLNLRVNFRNAVGSLLL